jgi:hypothetical protein
MNIRHYAKSEAAFSLVGKLSDHNHVVYRFDLAMLEPTDILGMSLPVDMYRDGMDVKAINAASPKPQYIEDIRKIHESGKNVIFFFNTGNQELLPEMKETINEELNREGSNFNVKENDIVIFPEEFQL